jgi:biotin transport system substrate-specific component
MIHSRISHTEATATVLDAVTIRTNSRAIEGAGKFAAVLFVTVLTCAAAQISIPLPFTPVPFTMQPIIVLVGGAALGARLGATSQVLYLALGIAGVPVFAASPALAPGLARLLGPTGGYLMSYPIAAFVAGWFAERRFDRRYTTALAAMAVGLALVFACGVVWLAFATRPSLGIGGALYAGFLPFIGADVLKLLVAAAVLPAFWRFIGSPR